MDQPVVGRMDAANPPSTMRNSCRQAPALNPAVAGSIPKNPGRQSASKGGAVSCGVVFVSPLQRRIQASRQQVPFNLPIPLLSDELFEPLGETSQFFCRQTGNGGFDFFNFHRQKIGQESVFGRVEKTVARSVRVTLHRTAGRLITRTWTLPISAKNTPTVALSARR